MQIRGGALIVGIAFAAVGWLLIGAAPQVAQKPVQALLPEPRSAATATVGPADIVNIDSANLGPDPLQLTAQASFTVLTVPVDRWFIMTSFEAVVLGQQFGGPIVQLDEVVGSVVTVKRNAAFLKVPVAFYSATPPLNSSIGLAFSPGSQVVLRNVAVDDPGGFPANGLVSFTLIGYMTMP